MIGKRQFSLGFLLFEIACVATALGMFRAVTLSNNGLTDGWELLAADLRTLSNHRGLPNSERDLLKRIWIEVDRELRNG
jgi:hypothetical protein